MKIKGIKSTVTSIVLKAHKGPKCEEKTQSRMQPRPKTEKLFFVVCNSNDSFYVGLRMAGFSRSQSAKIIRKKGLLPTFIL